MEAEKIGKMLTPVWIDSHNDSEDEFPEGKKITWKKGRHYTAWELNTQAGKLGGQSAHSDIRRLQEWMLWPHSSQFSVKEMVIKIIKTRLSWLWDEQVI